MSKNKRTLKGISADKKVEPKVESSSELPVTNMFIQGSAKKQGLGKPVKGVEYQVDPNDCKVWAYHNRDDAWMNPDRLQHLTHIL